MENFFWPVRLTSFDIDKDRRMSYSMILRLLQEAAGLELEEKDLSYSVLKERYHQVFLLVAAAIHIRRLPVYGEEVKAETWYHGPQGAKFARGMRLHAKDGVCVELGSHWALVDPETRRVIRPSRFACPEAMPPHPEELPVPVEKLHFLHKEKTESGKVCVGSRKVRYSDIDSNGHVNNAVYADLLCDFFPGGFSGHRFSDIRIDFRGEAREGEEIAIRAEQDGGTVWYEGEVEGRPCFLSAASLAPV